MVTEPTYSEQALPFSERLRQRARRLRTWLCVGVDPDLSWLPSHLPGGAAGAAEFSRAIVDATADLALCFKINFAFFEVLGPDGWAALDEVRRSIPADIPVIADAKRGDIGNTDVAYARAILEVLDFDAVTVSPYLGSDSVAPFASYPGRCVFLLCKTSNPGASELQDAQVDGEPLYLKVARQALGMQAPGEIGLVVGATQPEALRRVRALSEDAVFLMPGVGAQGATVTESLRAGGNSSGENALVSVSREILRASRGRDYASAARTAAEELARQAWIDPHGSH
jgi:orotidine 5'-phosphate decarboxylase subfamily 2